MIDPDEIESGVRTPLYLAVGKKYEVMLAQKTREVLRPKGAEETAFLRGYITAIQDCARLPAMLKAEIAMRRKQNARRAR